MTDDRALRDELERLQAESRTFRTQLDAAEASRAQLEEQLQRISQERDSLGILLAELRSGRPLGPAARRGKVEARIFRGFFSSREGLLEQTLAFAKRFAPEMLLDITHSEDADDDVFIVWHVGAPGVPEARDMPLKVEVIHSAGLEKWSTAVARATETIERLGAERVFSLTQSEDDQEGAIFIWYWDQTPPAP